MPILTDKFHQQLLEDGYEVAADYPEGYKLNPDGNPRAAFKTGEGKLTLLMNTVVRPEGRVAWYKPRDQEKAPSCITVRERAFKIL